MELEVGVGATDVADIAFGFDGECWVVVFSPDDLPDFVRHDQSCPRFFHIDASDAHNDGDIGIRGGQGKFSCTILDGGLEADALELRPRGSNVDCCRNE